MSELEDAIRECSAVADSAFANDYAKRFAWTVLVGYRHGDNARRDGWHARLGVIDEHGVACPFSHGHRRDDLGEGSCAVDAVVDLRGRLLAIVRGDLIHAEARKVDATKRVEEIEAVLRRHPR